MSNKADFCDKCSHWTPCAMDVKCLVCRYIGGIVNIHLNDSRA